MFDLSPALDNKLPKQNTDLLLRIAERFDRSARAQVAWATIAKKCFEFVEGKQWSAEDLAALNQAGRPALTLNKVRPLVMLVLGYHLQNRTDWKALPSVDDLTSPEMAQSITKILKIIASNSQVQYVDTEIMLDALVGGRGFYDSRLDFTDNELGEVKVTAVDPFSVFLDPEASDYDLSKGGHITVARWMSLDEVTITYGKSATEWVRPWLTTAGMGGGMPFNVLDFEPDIAPWRNFGGWDQNPDGNWQTIYDRFASFVDGTRKLVRLIDHQHYVVVPQLHFIDLETGDKEPIPDSWNRERIQRTVAYAESVGNPLAVQRLMRRRVRWSQVVGDLLVYDRWSPYDGFTITGVFPYFRRGVTQGIVEPLIDPQQEINKRRSARLNIIMRASNGGWIYDKKTLDQLGRENIRLNGSTAGVHIEYDSKNGTLPAPKQIEAPVSPVALEKVEADASQDLKEISGFSADALGFNDKVQSGRAIEAKTKSAIVGLEFFLSNTKRAKLLLGQRVLELVQRFYTEQRAFRMLGEDGKPARVEINVRTAQGIANNITIGKYEIAIDETPLAATFMEAQFAEALMLRDKNVPIPDDVLLELSSLGNIESIKQRVAAVRASMGLQGDIPTGMAVGAAPAGQPTAAPGASLPPGAVPPTMGAGPAGVSSPSAGVPPMGLGPSAASGAGAVPITGGRSVEIQRDPAGVPTAFDIIDATGQRKHVEIQRDRMGNIVGYNISAQAAPPVPMGAMVAA